MKNILLETKEGRDTYGIYVSIPNPTLVAMCYYAGYDFIRLDTEHSLFSKAELRECLRTASALGLPAWVRVANLDDITPILDSGASGIIVPDIKTKEQAIRIRDLVKYAPIGCRGMMTGSMELRFGLDPIAPNMEKANSSIALVLQLESQEALNNMNAILSVDGIDMISIGKQDLSQSLGIPGQVKSKTIVEAENKQIKDTILANKFPAPLVTSIERKNQLKEMGVHCFTIAYDIDMLMMTYKKHLEVFKNS